jgi:hypothetical protein
LEIPGGSLALFLELLELLELLPGFLATRSRLLRELFSLGLLHLVQLHHLFLLVGIESPRLRLWLVLVSLGSLDEHHGSGKSDYHTSWQRNAGNSGEELPRY